MNPIDKSIKIEEVLLNYSDLEAYAREIAKLHTVDMDNEASCRALLDRLDYNYSRISKAYQEINQYAKGRRELVPASDWLLDNFYKIEEQVKEVKQNLRRERFLKLKILSSGIFKGFPRAYIVALEYVFHTDGRVDEELLTQFIKAYQSNNVLTIAEIWSLSLMIRVALVENIRNLCERVLSSEKQWRRAEAFINEDPELLLNKLKDSFRNKQSIEASFLQHILKECRREGIDTGNIIALLEDILKEYNTNLQGLVEEEHRQQAVTKITIGNSISSLNVVATLDWNDIFEDLSVVEGILREDPGETYAAMDFESRDYYRRVIERLAKVYGVKETSLAKAAVELAGEAEGELEKHRHVGYYLLDKGREKLLDRLGLQVAKDPMSNKRLSHYILPIALAVAVATSAFMAYAYRLTGGVIMVLLVGLVVFIPISQIVLSIANRYLSGDRGPTLIPRLAYGEGVPEESFTMVIVPTLLSGVVRVQEIVRQLEVHYLANREKNLRFALVGDFKDASQEQLPEDEEIIKTALSGINLLNQRYGGEGEIFYYFHRGRRLNEKDNRWMGWERKRGAITEFNRLIMGEEDTGYTTISGDITALKKTKYVITLDADTILPLSTAKTLIGMMAHPLNDAVIDKERGIVTEGYGLIQPRVGVNIESKYRNFFTKVFSGPSGIDIYTTASSDIYQDLFSEGIYTGKGIYNLRVFEALLGETIPDNSILSHDLLEGSFIRTGLASDVEVIDGYPIKFSSYMLRLHRWTRGDWQLMPYLASKIMDREGRRIANPLTPLTKWKILDNMRRSLVSPSLFLLIFLGISIFPGQALLWVATAVITIFTPFFIGSFDYFKVRLSRLGEGGIERSHALEEGFQQGLLTLTFLPYQAYMLADAIGRSLYRVYISRQSLLEWVTVADSESNLKDDIFSSYKRMRINIIAAIALVAVSFMLQSQRLLLVAAFGLLWAFGPRIDFKINTEAEGSTYSLSPQDKKLIRRNARKTWCYFEDFANAENQYLPPDNYQLFPPNGVAHRTSPTNIGLLLASTVAARDMGYLTTTGMVDRIEKTIGTVERLETWRGHLYNWYDTKSLEVLRPLYISSVDSGNFVSYLVAAVEGLKEYLEERPLLDLNLVRGIRDTLLLYESNEDMNFFEIIDPIEGSQNPTLNRYLEALEALMALQSVARHEKLADLIQSIRLEAEALLPTDEEMKLFKSDLKLEDLTPIALLERYAELLSQTNRPMDDMDTAYSRLKHKHENLKDRIDKTRELMGRMNALINATEFKHLYNEKRNLFSIGYNVEEERLTNSYYDLLASEARTTSYWAIARGEVPKKHWFKLGRAISEVNGSRALVSWTGTMFEYYMAPLLLKNYDYTLMDETLKAVIEAQVSYGEKRQVPWGVSESGYYAFDLVLNYQYRAFGIPDLGLKRGLIEDTVISPYSTMLALPFDPSKAMANLKKLLEEGLEGEYGFYEAVDYTQRGISSGENKKIVKSFMVHHLGMSLLAVVNMLNNNVMVRRYHSNPVIKAAETLLQERIPINAIVTKEFKEVLEPVEEREIYREKVVRSFGAPESLPQNCHLLSNGRLSLMLTETGEGYSRLDNLQVTRWREELVGGSYGSFILINHINTNNVWSSTYHPMIKDPDGYKTIFSMDRAEFIRNDDNLVSHTEIAVAPEDNIEIRKLKLTNHGQETAVVEVSSYFEPVLVPQAADVAHPAFSNLFVRTEFLGDLDTLLASRRPREHGQAEKWLLHSLIVEGETTGGLQYETNRGNFIGRGKGLNNAFALNQPLTNSTGVAIDPIMSLRRKLRIEGGKTAVISYITGIADSKEEAIQLVRKYNAPPAIERSYQLAYTRSQVELNYLNLKSSEVLMYQGMIKHLLYMSPLKAKYRKYISQNKRGQSGLWPFGVSGDLPIILISIKRTEDIDIVRQVLKAHEYWKLKGLKVDLVILNEDESSYLQPLKNLLRDVVAFSHGRHIQDQPGGIFIRDVHSMSEEDRLLFYSVARLIITGEGGSLKEQLKLPQQQIYSSEAIEKRRVNRKPSKEEEIEVDYFNGYGGFSKDGREYIIKLKENLQTPAPWVNVVSNESFGFIVSENGSGYTWAENSRENKLTPWNNDPVSDTGHEIIYLRDDDTGELWSITPLPIREKEGYIIRHGMGYSVIQHNSHGIGQQLTQFVPEKDSIKINLMRLKNDSDAARRLSVFYYIRPVLGVSHQSTQQYIVTEHDPKLETIWIKNPFNSDFPGQMVFVGASSKISSYTGNREEFIGHMGSLAAPEALNYEGLSMETGAGFDPCVVLHTRLELKKGQEGEVALLLGQSYTVEGAKELLEGYRSTQRCHEALEGIKTVWRKRVDRLQVKTPDPSMDLMLNSWLLYQTISCRLWSRSAFYQSGGAYGYRDQLQDVMNIMHVYPEAARRQILIHCQHQFVEGDVQHWWHPGAGEKGIRTKFSDDLLWLPLVTVEYLRHTGDYQLLEEVSHFLEEEPLDEKTDERYGIPRISEESTTIYDHCIRAIERGLKFGIHDIPLMGSGDWNDGMSTVGNKGKGESVWLGWFMNYILKGFAEVCDRMQEPERAARYRETAVAIAQALEESAWDGEWYIRAFYDDGSPLGSSKNTECIIDSLAQSWSIISGAGQEERSRAAMKAVDNYLIKREEGLILLFTPPFDNSDQNPGYIKGYVPGVRENGGQYTHAAVWVINAFAELGEGKTAQELFNLINPINHTRTPLECATYKVEPYVMAADVYAVGPHVGRGGWTWYTGAAGWMYRVGIENILGLRRKGDKLYFTPSIPPEWQGYEMKYQYEDTSYEITFSNPEGVATGIRAVSLDGEPLPHKEVPLVKDGQHHRVEVVMGKEKDK